MTKVLFSNETMTELLNICSEFYQIPSEIILYSRKLFYLSQKEKEESVLEWLRRIKTCVDTCDFGTLTDFFLIDKFTCELDTDEIALLKSIGTLSLERLLEALENQTFFIDVKEDVDELSDDIKHEILEIKLDIVSDLFL